MKAAPAIQYETSGSEFTITCELAARRAAVFQAWTDARQMELWWGPHSFTNPVCELHAHVGGRMRIVMRGPDGTEYPFKGEYYEVVEPERLVYLGDTSEHPASWHEQLAKNLPAGSGKVSEQSLTTVTFEGNSGKTKLTVCSRFATKPELQAYMKLGMAQGWSQSLERLAVLLS
jgi:uncharacterized protein YndB with AHSA1/START domain